MLVDSEKLYLNIVKKSIIDKLLYQSYLIKYYRTTRLIKELNLAYATAKYEKILQI